MEKPGRFQLCAIAVVLIVGCGAADVGGALDGAANETTDEDAEPGAAPDLPEQVVTALGVFAEQVGRPVEELTVEAFEEAVWPDACLGMADKDEMCAQVIVNGWRIEVRAGDDAWELRTNASGEQVRWQPK